MLICQFLPTSGFFFIYFDLSVKDNRQDTLLLAKGQSLLFKGNDFSFYDKKSPPLREAGLI